MQTLQRLVRYKKWRPFTSPYTLSLLTQVRFQTDGETNAQIGCDIQGRDLIGHNQFETPFKPNSFMLRIFKQDKEHGTSTYAFTKYFVQKFEK